MNILFKKDFIKPFFAIAVAIVVCSILIISHAAHAQVAVLDSNGDTVAGTGAGLCVVGSDSGGIQVPVKMYPNGKVYAITGNYSVSIDCGDQAGTVNCTNLKNAVSAVENEGNNLPNFPQTTISPSSNSISIEVGHFKGICGSTVNACEYQGATINGDGAKNHAWIFLDEDAPANPAAVAYYLSNPNAIQSLLTHEIAHAFGLGDAYIFNKNDPGTMGTGELVSIEDPSIPAAMWDSTAIAVIQEINMQYNSNDPLVVNGSCTSICQDNAIYTLSTSSNGYYNPSCVTGSASSSINYCNCNPTDGSAPYCLEGASIVPAPTNICPESSAGTLSGVSGVTDGDSCTSSGSECFDASGNLAVCPVSVTDSNWCSAGSIPSGEICTCASGNAFCSNGSGSVEPPSSFSCQLPATNAYSCQNDSCVFVGSGGTYSDASCNNACTTQNNPGDNSGDGSGDGDGE